MNKILLENLLFKEFGFSKDEVVFCCDG